MPQPEMYSMYYNYVEVVGQVSSTVCRGGGASEQYSM